MLATIYLLSENWRWGMLIVVRSECSAQWEQFIYVMPCWLMTWAELWVLQYFCCWSATSHSATSQPGVRAGLGGCIGSLPLSLPPSPPPSYAVTAENICRKYKVHHHLFCWIKLLYLSGLVTGETYDQLSPGRSYKVIIDHAELGHDQATTAPAAAKQK